MSGREAPLREQIAGLAAGMGLYARFDSMGNLFVCCKEESLDNCYTLIAAHMDEEALLITGFTEEGFLRFTPVGETDGGILPGTAVMINGMPGVIGCKAIHHCSKEEREKEIPVEDLYIDMGFTSKEEAEKAVFPGDAAYYEDGAAFTCRAANRYACLLLTELFNGLEEDRVLAFTVQGEVGHRGAVAAAFRTAPARVLALGCADLSEAEGLALGKGPVVPLADRRAVCDADYVKQIKDAAERSNIAIQSPALLKEAHAAGPMQQAGIGAGAAMLLLPCAHLHTPRSVIRPEDYEAAVKLLRLIR